MMPLKIDGSFVYYIYYSAFALSQSHCEHQHVHVLLFAAGITVDHIHANGSAAVRAMIQNGE